jgi:hypothetical protein
MSREKTLNIHNTDRKFNLNLTTKQDEANFIKVTRLNEKQIENDMDRLEDLSHRFNRRDHHSYMLFQERYSNDTVQEKVFNHGGFIYYYTSGKVPIPVINKLAGVPQSEVIYYCKKEYSVDDVLNVQMSSMATKVSVDVPVVLPDINVFDYLFALYPLRYHVDKVRISFPALSEKELQDRHKPFYTFYNGAYHLKSKYKYECFKHLQEPLSTWKMNIWVICDSKMDMNKVEGRVMKDNKRFRKNGGEDIDSES